MASAAPIMGAPTRAPTIARRTLLGAFALIPATASAAVPQPCPAGSWVTRWKRLGCGARLDANGNLRITLRVAEEGAAAEMLAELARPGSATKVRQALIQVDTGCAALRAVEHIRSIEGEHIDADEDPAGNQAWCEQWSAAAWRLSKTPAQSSAGLAAKLREGIALNGSELGEAIVHAALSQLEAWS